MAGVSPSKKKIKGTVPCLSFRSSFARLLLRYAPGSSPTVAKSIKRSVEQQSKWILVLDG